MKPPRFTYVRAESVEEAIAARQRYEGEASILAGGQSLMPMLNFRLARPAALIDLSGVPDLDYTFLDDTAVVVGAMRRQRDVELDADAIARCPLLLDALHNVAHPAIRNRGTVGGTIAHADASAELPTTLVALRGAVRVEGPSGQRSVAAEDFFAFHLTTTLEPDEVVVAVEFPNLEPGTGTAFVEVARRHGDYALAGVGTALRLDDAGRLRDVRLAVSGIAPIPTRAGAVEALLDGAAPDDAVLAEAGRLAAELVDVVDEEQASEAYRRQLVNVLVPRAIGEAVANAGAR